MSWATDINRLVTKGGHDLGELCKAVKVELFSGIVSDTRVDTGRLKGNWQIQDESPAQGTLGRLDPNGTAVDSEIQHGSTPDGKTYFVNNLPYAKVWEERDAMIGRNVARVRQVVREMAKKVRG